MIDLMQMFNADYSDAPINLEQNSYYFAEAPEVHFINEQGEIVENYDLLPSVKLTPEEQSQLDARPEPKLNEPQIIIKGVKYEGGKVLLNAYKTDYKFVSAYASGKVFPPESPIYEQKFFKTGSIAALITSDNKTVIVERNDAWKLFSCFSGFLQPQKVNEHNVAIATAVEEAREEFFNYTGIEIEETDARIDSVSFRKGNVTGKFGTAEFIVTLKVKCTAAELEQALNENLTKATKPDGKPDHTGRYKIIDPNNPVTKEDLTIVEEDGSTKDIMEKSFFLVRPILTAVYRNLGLEIPSFLNIKQISADELPARSKEVGDEKTEEAVGYWVSKVNQQSQLGIGINKG